MALWAESRRAMSWANAVSAVSEKDCCVLKLVAFGNVAAGRTERDAVAGASVTSGRSFKLLGW